jgi:hypothetical protein
MDYAEQAHHRPSTFPWRTATVVVGVVAAIELVALIGIGAVHLATPLRAHGKTATHVAASARPAVHRVRRVAAVASRPARLRAKLSVLVLNGNGVNGAAGGEATSLQTFRFVFAAKIACLLSFSISPRSIVNCTTRWIALSCFACRLPLAQDCQ